MFDTETRKAAYQTHYIKQHRKKQGVFQNHSCDNIFLQRSHDSIWRELLSEIARIFDKANTGSSENCTLLRLRSLCLKEQYSALFPSGEKDNLVQSLDTVFEIYDKLPIKESRNKQLSHHDLKQLFGGGCIEISMDQVENLIANTTDVFTKIYNRFDSAFLSLNAAEASRLCVVNFLR